MDKSEKLKKLMQKSRIEYIKDLEGKINGVFYDYMAFCTLGDESHRYELKRFFHSVKGTAATLGFDILASHGLFYEALVNDLEGNTVVSKEILFNIMEGITKVYDEFRVQKADLITANEVKIQVDELPVEANTIKIETHTMKTEANTQVQPTRSICEGTAILIEKDETAWQNYYDCLTMLGVKIIKAEKTSEALILMKAESIDLLIINVLTRDKNGFDFLEEIRGVGITTPVLFIADDKIIVDVLIISNQPFVLKNMSLDVFQMRVEEILKRKPEIMDNIPQVHSVVPVYSEQRVQEEQERQIQPLKQKGVQQKLSTVLVVDDDKVLLGLLQEALTDEGFYVLNTASTHDVIDILSKNNVDVMLLDVVMYDRSGFEVFKEVRENHYNLPVIFMSGDEITLEETLENNMYDYIKKPFQIEELAAKVRKTLSQQQTVILSEENATSVKNENDQIEGNEYLDAGYDYDDLRAIINTYSGSVSGLAGVDGVEPEKEKILFINLDTASQDLMKKAMSKFEYEAYFVDDAREGLIKLKGLLPAITVISGREFDPDPIEIAGMIKSGPGLSDMKVVILSELKGREMFSRCHELGIDDYIIKPLDEETIVRSIKNLSGQNLN